MAAQLEARRAEQAVLQAKLDQDVLNSLKLPKATSRKTEVLGQQVKETAKKDPSLTAQVLRTWIADQEAKDH